MYSLPTTGYSQSNLAIRAMAAIRHGLVITMVLPGRKLHPLASIPTRAWYDQEFRYIKALQKMISNKAC